MTYDTGVIITLIATTMGSTGAILAMMFWCRTEANSLRDQATMDRREIIDLIRAIDGEVKDFHYRLIEVEKGRK